MLQHIPDHGPVLDNPRIGLLSSRGIEDPLSILKKLWELCRIAVPLTKCVFDTVLGGKVKDIHWE